MFGWCHNTTTITAVTRQVGFHQPWLCLLQNNKISIWSIGNNGSSGTDDGFEGDPQLLCEHKHDGDVLDLQVSLLKRFFPTLKKSLLWVCAPGLIFCLGLLIFYSFWTKTESSQHLRLEQSPSSDTTKTVRYALYSHTVYLYSWACPSHVDTWSHSQHTLDSNLISYASICGICNSWHHPANSKLVLSNNV